MSSLMLGSLAKRLGECQESLDYLAESCEEERDKMYI